ncbi:MAG: MotA/TolQ/ExbB proton channel family protein [Pseudomonadota bacterium]
MELVTLLAILAALGMVVTTIAMGGNIGMFFNLPGLLLVLGGTFTVTLAMVSWRHFLNSFKIAAKVMGRPEESPMALIERIVELAKRARRDGLLALEDEEISNDFLRRGIQMSIDGQPPEIIRATLNNEINQSLQRHEVGQRMFRSIADVAPAMGMIGTLIGLVQMLAQMDDPKKIGPAMAVAILTTLYGAIIANAIALPIAEKLALRSQNEALQKTMILEGLDGLQAQTNPILLRQMLLSFLPAHERMETVPMRAETEQA